MAPRRTGKWVSVSCQFLLESIDVQTLSESMQVRCIKLVGLLRQGWIAEGKTPSDEELAVALRLTPEEVTATRTVLVEQKKFFTEAWLPTPVLEAMLDGKDRTSTERVRKYRAKKQMDRHETQPETAKETAKETPNETKDETFHSGFKGVSAPPDISPPTPPPLLTPPIRDSSRCSESHAAGPPPSGGEESGASGKQDLCPHQKIIDLYHRILPELPPVREWGAGNRKHLRQRWREKKDRRNLEWWERFFQEIRASDFLMGKKKDFVATLGWVIKPTSFEKILNGQYENRGGRSYEPRQTTGPQPPAELKSFSAELPPFTGE